MNFDDLETLAYNELNPKRLEIRNVKHEKGLNLETISYCVTLVMYIADDQRPWSQVWESDSIDEAI